MRADVNRRNTGDRTAVQISARSRVFEAWSSRSGTGDHFFNTPPSPPPCQTQRPVSLAPIYRLGPLRTSPRPILSGRADIQQTRPEVGSPKHYESHVVRFGMPGSSAPAPHRPDDDRFNSVRPRPWARLQQCLTRTRTSSGPRPSAPDSIKKRPKLAEAAPEAPASAWGHGLLEIARGPLVEVLFRVRRTRSARSPARALRGGRASSGRARQARRCRGGF